MGRFFLVGRLAARDLQKHVTEAGLFLLAIAAATTALALGLILHGVTDRPYQQTRTATAGPDVVATTLDLPRLPAGERLRAGLSELAALTHAAGVVAHDGPYPLAWPILRTHGLEAAAFGEGRDPGSAPIDQPKLTQGSWIRPGGVVVERAFASALHLSPGDSLTLNGRPFHVDGVAVSAADSPYPYADFTTYGGPYPEPGLVWLTRADARRLATHALPLSYTENLRLAHPSQAQAFAYTHTASTPALGLSAWQDISQHDARTVTNEQRVLVTGSALLVLLALASVAVLVGGRMAEQTRRVGLLKAVGATPRLIASVLLAEHLLLALVAAALGLFTGWLSAPLLTRPGAGLIGNATTPTLTPFDIALVVTVALLIALAATLVPATRAARTTTISALADDAHRPSRHPIVSSLSSRLPVPLLLGLRLAARRPRRAILSGASVAITVTTLVAALTAHSHLATARALSTLANPRIAAIDTVLATISVTLGLLAAANAVFIAWMTTLDARRPLAVARALGADATQIVGGISTAQLIPAVPGAILGVPAGIALVAALSHGETATTPSPLALAAIVLGTLLVLALLTALPARIGTRRSVAAILQSERA